MKNVICVIGALKDEIFGVKERMECYETIPIGMGKAFLGRWHDKQILLVRSGIGCYRSQKVLEEICKHYSVSEILSIGFAGALTSDLSLGDLIIADTIREIKTNKKPTVFKEIDLLSVDQLLVDKALKLGFSESFSCRSGGLVTVDQPVCRPEEKNRLRKYCEGLAVDMESYALLRLSLKMRIPFLSVRAISDTVKQELIDFSNCIDSSGEVSRVKAGWYVLTHPGLIPKVEPLRKGAKSAAKNLTRFLDEWISYKT